MERFWTTFFYIVVMAAILVAAYLTTKFLAQKSRRMGSRHIRMHDSMMIGRDRTIAVIEVAGKTLLIGITNQSINVLADIDASELNNAPEETGVQGPKGFAARTAGFFAGMKDAPKNLSAARTQMKKARREKPAEDGDFLSQMDEAIKRRKSFTDESGREEE